MIGDYFLVSGGFSNINYSEIKALNLNTGEQMWALPSSTSYKYCFWVCDPAHTQLALGEPKGPVSAWYSLAGMQPKFRGWLGNSPTALSPTGRQFTGQGPQGCLLFEKGQYDRVITLAIDFHEAAPEFSLDASLLAIGAQGVVLVADLAKVQAQLDKLRWRTR